MPRLGRFWERPASDCSYASAQAIWKSPRPITQQERAQFARSVELYRADAFRRYGLSPESELTARQQDDVDRFSVSRALVARGYLLFTRRRITPPLKSVFRASLP